jgi:ADP-heptose:LPS heptosyltransferase
MGSMATARFPILVFAPAAREEAIFASGLIGKLLDEVGHASFTIVASDKAAPLFRDTPRLERLILSPGPGRLAAFKVWRQLQPRRWGLVLDLEGFPMARSLRARQRAGPPEPPSRPEHRVVQAARLLKLADAPPAPRIFVGEDTERRAEQLVGGRGPLLALAPGAPWIGETWPAENFARTASALASAAPLAGGRVLVVGDAEDKAAARSVQKSLPKDRCIDLTGQDDPLLVYAALKRAALCIGNAAWPMHLAAAAGIATLGLYGPADERLEGPWGPRARAVRGPRTAQEIRAIDPALSQPICHMLDLPVETVVERARRLLKEAASPV